MSVKSKKSVVPLKSVTPPKPESLTKRGEVQPTDTLSDPSSYTGHVRNGVAILDAEITLSEGQAVRI